MAANPYHVTRPTICLKTPLFREVIIQRIETICGNAMSFRFEALKENPTSQYLLQTLDPTAKLAVPYRQLFESSISRGNQSFLLAVITIINTVIRQSISWFMLFSV